MASLAASTSVPAAAATTRAARWYSFTLLTRTSIIRPAKVLPQSACAATDIAFSATFAPSSAARGARRARSASWREVSSALERETSKRFRFRSRERVSSVSSASRETRSTKTASAPNADASPDSAPPSAFPSFPSVASTSHGGVFGSRASARTHRNANDARRTPSPSGCLARSRAIARRAARRWRAARAPSAGVKSTSRNVFGVFGVFVFVSAVSFLFAVFETETSFASSPTLGCFFVSASRTYASHETSKRPRGKSPSRKVASTPSRSFVADPLLPNSAFHPPPPNARYFSAGVPNVGRCSEASTSAATVTPATVRNSVVTPSDAPLGDSSTRTLSAISANSATLTSETSPPAATAPAALAHAEAAPHASRETNRLCALRVAASKADKARDVSAAAVRSSAGRVFSRLAVPIPAPRMTSATANAASRMILVALPPFSRDEPATSSGPRTGLTKTTSSSRRASRPLGPSAETSKFSDASAKVSEATRAGPGSERVSANDGNSSRKPPRSGASRRGLNPSAKRATVSASLPSGARAPKRPASARNDDTYGALKPQDTPTTTSDLSGCGSYAATARRKSLAPRSRSSSHDSAL